jgi:2-polyprenyl-3-methyl-5-hydroxy-6-metoxy-1,4-benzoquinol methylase
MNATQDTCIVCHGKANAILDWSFEDIKREYEDKFGRSFPKEAKTPDYAMMKCAKCGLVYATPAVPGNACFYAWITSTQNYYQSSRWEWGVVSGLLAKGAKKKLLEIGCGTGNFLAFISSRLDIDAVGIDTHAPSVDACANKGLNAKHSDLAQFIQRQPESRYDAICAFHCLEHVDDPRSLIQLMSKALAPGGRIFISVPYSPTSLDAVQADCMNLPPHHLTQWNKNSLVRLGKVVGLDVDVLTDDGIFVDSMARTFYWYFISNLKAGSTSSLYRNLFRMVAHPALLLKCALFIATRDTVAGKRAGDTALAIFRR